MKIHHLLTGLFLICLTLNPIAVKAQLPKDNQIIEGKTETNQPLDSSKLRVGVTGAPPIVIKSNAQSDRSRNRSGGVKQPVALTPWKNSPGAPEREGNSSDERSESPRS